MSLYEKYPDGIKAYEKAVLNVIVHFPKGDVKCKYCRFCMYDRNSSSYICAVTRETLYAVDKGVGYACPLESEE